MLSQRMFLVVTLCSLAIAGAATRTAYGDLIGYWNFDGNVNDQSGMGNDGDLVDAVYSDNVPAAIGQGQSVDFQNDTDHVFIENADGSLDLDEFTLAMFVFDRGQSGAMERLTSREGDTFETAINVHGPFNGMGEYSYYSPIGGGWKWGEEIPPLEQWQHVTYVADASEQTLSIYVDGELTHTSGPAAWVVAPTGFMHIGNRHNDVEGFNGMIDDVAVWDEVLPADAIKTIAQVGVDGFLNPRARLQPGDADMDLDFDQLDLVRVQIAAKYLSGQTATWGEGDWNGAPGGEPGNPPIGDGVFNQLDIIAALGSGKYLTGPYGAVRIGGVAGDAQTSVGYNVTTGEVFVDAPAGRQLTSINIDSASSIFTGAAAQNLGGSFDNDADNNIFKATFGSSFGSLTFGNVAQAGLSRDFVAGDLSVVGSLAGGGDLGNVDLIYVPEPSAIVLMMIGLWAAFALARRR